MAIADTITSMQNHTSNAYTMIGYGTDLTGINKNLENLSTSIFNAFLEALRNPDTLFTNLPKKSGSGANITLNDTANAPMRIELGATELTQASTPTPSSPQDIHTISGSNTIKVEGKNLLNAVLFAGQSGSGGGITTKVNTDGSINMKGLGTDNYAGYLTLTIPSMPALNGEQLKLSITSSNTHIGYYLQNPSGYNTTLIYDSSQPLKILIQATSANGLNIDETFNIQLELGYTATTYTPYASQEADIDLKSKQLFNKNNSTSNYYLAQDGTPVSSNNYDYTEYIPIKPSTYYMATGFTTGTGDAPSRCYYDENKNFIIGYKHGQATDILNASPSNAYYMRESVKKVDVDTIQIYEAPYYDYGFYGKISTYEDKFIRSNDGTWQLEKNIGKVVLDGTENWGSASEGDTTNGISMYLGITGALSSSSKVLISDYFNYITRTSLTSSSINFLTSGGGNSIVLNIAKNSLSEETLNGFKTWLTTHNTNVYYPLSTPTYTKITGTLAEQLENVYQKMLSQAGQTNISQVNNDLSFVINASALEEL